MGIVKKISFGRTGLDVTELCFGTLTMSRLQANLDPSSTIGVFQKALEYGVNFFDTAHGYQTYEHVRLGLGKDINKVVISTKSTAPDLATIKEHAEFSFKTFNREMIDIFLMHNVNSKEEFNERRPVLDYLLELKRKGKLRAVGISTHKIAGNLVAADNSDLLDVIMPIINYKAMGITDGTLDQALSSIKKCHDAGLGIYAMKPLGGGHLRKDAKTAIDFLRKNESVDVIALGMKSVDEVEVNVALFSDGKMKLDGDKFEKLKDTDRRIFVNFMCRACGTCFEYCHQQAISLTEDKKKAQIDTNKCVLCGYCAPHCPQFSIRVV